MVQGLLNLARRDDLTLSPGDLHAVIEASATSVRNAKLPASVTLTTSLAAQPSQVLMDADQMQQVLVNLISNAVQAMPAAGGSVRVATAVVPVPQDAPRTGRRAALFRPGDHTLVAEVADTGTGSSEGHLAKIWEPFFTTKPRGQGTGLGLAIVRSIVEHHHGFIDVTSVVGQGTTFRITLPLPPRA